VRRPEITFRQLLKLQTILQDKHDELKSGNTLFLDCATDGYRREYAEDVYDMLLEVSEIIDDELDEHYDEHEDDR